MISFLLNAWRVDGLGAVVVQAGLKTIVADSDVCAYMYTCTGMCMCECIYVWVNHREWESLTFVVSPLLL